MSSPPDHSDTVSPTPELSDTAHTRLADPLVSGLKSLLDPTIKQTTEKLLLVHQSQQALSAELDRLISRTSSCCRYYYFQKLKEEIELQHYLETTDPPALKPTVVKLAATSKRLTAVNCRFLPLILIFFRCLIVACLERSISAIPPAPHQ
jgi:hypothetical protein